MSPSFNSSFKKFKEESPEEKAFRSAAGTSPEIEGMDVKEVDLSNLTEEEFNQFLMKAPNDPYALSKFTDKMVA